MSRGIRRLGNANGSLPLALLVTIMVAGVVVVLVARTAASQRQVQFDQAFHGVLPAADAAVEMAKFRLNNEIMLTSDDDGQDYEPEAFPVGQTTVPETHEVDGRSFTWFMTRQDGFWEVDSTSIDTRGRTDVQRRVKAELRDQPLLSIAAFADIAFQLGGANTADSYNSDTGEWCTGSGYVASNGVVTFEGVASPGPCASVRPTGRTVDQVILYDWQGANVGQGATAELPGGDRCGQKVGNNVDPDHPNCKELAHPAGEFPAPARVIEPIQPTVGDATAFIDDALAACEEYLEDFAPETLVDYRSTAASGSGQMPAGGTHLSLASSNHPEMGDLGLGLKGRYYCYENVFLDADTTIDADASIDNPVIMFVRGNLHMAAGNNQNQRVRIGCGTGGCTPGVSTPEAGRLWIFVLGQDVGIRAQSEFAGVVWAPESSCGGIGPGGGGPSSQVDFYGSIVCGTASNTGGWRFHYDEALGGATDGKFVRTRWQELPSG